MSRFLQESGGINIAFSLSNKLQQGKEKRMKVLLINGSPHENGCTFTALHKIAETLELQDVSTEIFHIGKTPVGGCMDCGYCAEKKNLFL